MIARIPLTAKVPVFLEPEPEGGYTVTSPLIPELLTEGDTIEEVLKNIQEVFGLIIEMYEDEDGVAPLSSLPRKRESIRRGVSMAPTQPPDRLN